ncbi:MAG: hypothetical protein ACI9TH_004609, partial [Kiritimatiellia bacterium]
MIVIFSLLLGKGITNSYFGVLIEPTRSRYSLSRSQSVVWTIVIHASYMAAAFGNLAAGVADPLAIAVPREMWLLMGISATSLAGTP